MVKIYITGCARSGTTLLARLFNAFQDCYVINEEVSVDDFCSIGESYFDGWDSKPKFLVGKRTEFTVFGQILSTHEKERQLSLLESNNVVIINCVRDGRYVVDGWVKEWGIYNPFVWMQSILDSIYHMTKIQITVRYEVLISDPNFVQRELPHRISGLISSFDFSSYPSFVPEKCFESKSESRKLRPIENKIGGVPDSYLKVPNNVMVFNSLLSYLQYKL